MNFIREELQELNPDAMIIDDMDNALIGIDEHSTRAVYSVGLIVAELRKINEWDYETAMEWYGFNISTAYVGEFTPILVHTYREIK
jgi:hypothetical protein